MTFVNLLLVFWLVGIQDFASSGYGLLSVTFGVVLAATTLSGCLFYAMSLAVAWAVSALSTVSVGKLSRTDLTAIVGHLLVLNTAAAYFSTYRSWLMPTLWLLGTSLAFFFLWRAASKTLCNFITVGLMGAILVAGGEAVVNHTRERPDVAGGTRGDYAQRGNIYYILLDAQAGFPAFPDFIEGASEERDRQRTEYRELGFDIHELAYTHHMWTDSSVYSILDNRIHEALPKDGVTIQLPPNKLFDGVLSRGYRPLLYYSNYLKMCEAAAAYQPECRIYRTNSLGSHEPAAADHALVLLGLAQRLMPLPLLREKRRVHGLRNAVSVFDQMIADIDTHPTNTFVFAHLLLPHEPLVLDEECRLRDSEIFDLSVRRYYSPKIGRGTAKKRWEAYVPQTACVRRRLGEFVAALHAKGIFEESTIIVHGDHGTRISWTGRYGPAGPARKLSKRLFLDFYSTLFMVKPGDFELTRGVSDGVDAWAPVSLILSKLMGWPGPENGSAVYNEELVPAYEPPFEPGGSAAPAHGSHDGV